MEVPSAKSNETPLCLHIHETIFLKYSFYANLTKRGILKQIAQFDSSEYYLKDHT